MVNRFPAALLIFAVVVSLGAHRTQAGSPLLPQSLTARTGKVVEEALASPEAKRHGISDNLRMLGFSIAAAEPGRAKITIDLSEDILDVGSQSELETAIKYILSAAAAPVARYVRDIEFQIMVNHVRLESLFTGESGDAQVPGSAARTSEDARLSIGAQGKRIVISPGHGWYYNEAAADWRLQRSYFFGIVEDFVNADISIYLQSRLASAGADVRPSRNMDKNAGSGVSGHPRWQEAARYYIQSLGVPASVWNETGYTQLDQDIRSRPRYANWVNADILVSVHNNGSQATGTEVWFDSANGYQADSRRLADAVRQSLISAIRSGYAPGWVDRLTQSCNGCYGENRIATRPSIIVEIAFMDTQSPDNAALQDEAFKSLVADAISRGIDTYFGSGCSYSISPTSQSFGASGGTGSVGVTAGGGCSWTATSNASWITLTSASSGSGNGTVSYTVAANSSVSARSATLTIAGQAYTVTQAGAVGCTAATIGIGQTVSGSLTSSDCRSLARGSTYYADQYSFSASAGQQIAALLSSAAFDSYLYLRGPTGAIIAQNDDGGGGTNSRIPLGSGVFTLPSTGAYVLEVTSFSANITGAYSLVLSGATPCTYSLSSSSQSFGAGGGSGSVNVTAPSGCSWSVSGVPSWTTLTSASSGSGNGTVSYTVAANSSTGGRSATLTIAGQSYTVSQSGTSCTYSLSSSSQSFGAGGGSGSVNVTAPSGCGWSVSGVPSWTTLTSASSGSGNGTVSYTVAANSSTGGRSATLTIAGQSYTVSQSGTSCTYSLSSSSQSFGAGGGSGSVNVTAPSGCGWSVSGVPSWTTLTSASSGSGNGTVSYTVAANSSTSGRSATLTIAGQSYTVTQAGVAGCTEVESNNSSTTANPLSISVPCTGKISSSTDVDWYSINKSSGTTFSFYLTVPAGLDYDLEVYGPSSGNLTPHYLTGSTNGAGVAESATWTASTSGTFYARIVGFQGAFSTTAAYTITRTQ